ncbi:MAG: alpha-galactosidase, partial [Ferruginibacter sp.]
MKILYTFLFCSLLAGYLSAQPFASWTKNELALSNGVVQRTIQLPAANGNFMTKVYKPVEGEFTWFLPSSADFQFEVNGIKYSGRSAWNLSGIKHISDTRQGDGAAVSLISSDKKIEVIVNLLLYPNLPVIRKSLTIKNIGTANISLESIDVEKFATAKYRPSTFSWIYTNYGRRKVIGPYEGNMQDALVIVHNMNWESGIVIGNEATGVLKRTTAFWNADEICSGLTHSDSRYPFRKWLKANESFETPQVFTMVYNNQKEPGDILNESLPDFIRKHMGIRLSELQQKPTFVYNTWVPFKKNINEKLVMDLAKAAADAGMKEFVIDDGWADNYGDWVIDKTKFPNGLKPVFDYIKSLGMKPGIWVSVGSASPKSKVFKAHPEWFVVDEKQQPFNLHISDTSIVTACFSTGWYGYIKGVLQKL